MAAAEGAAPEPSTPWRELSGGQEEESGATPMRRSSSRLLRAASASFTGGATVMPPQAEDEAPSRRSLRRQNRSTVQARMWEELWARYQIMIIFFLVSLLLFSFTMVVLFFRALWAVLNMGQVACDQPLNLYLFSSFFIGQITPQMVKLAQRMPWAQRPRYTFAISMAGSVPGWIVIGWGFSMLRASKTCRQTNPELFYETRDFIYGQIILFLLTTVFFSVGFTGVLAYWHTFASEGREGCEVAVHKLERVAHDAEELVDHEDGRVMECPICSETFGSELVTVRTTCNHHFHEACLAKWCKNHMDCPMCRAPVGEADGSPGLSP